METLVNIEIQESVKVVNISDYLRIFLSLNPNLAARNQMTGQG